MKQSEELKIAIEAAKESGKILKKYFGKSIKSYRKKEDTIDYVTEVDLKVQDKIVEIVKKNFPDHGFLGEEKGLDLRKKHRWIIDPIDGTLSFMYGLPLLGISIALEKDRKIVIGVINNPITEEIYWGELGKGAYKNNKKIAVSQNKNLADALMFFTFDKKLAARENIIKFIRSLKKDYKSLISAPSSVVGLGWLSEGKIDGQFDIGLYWDFAAGKIIAEEAGAVVTDWQGKEFKEDSGYILVANKYLHKELLKRTKKIR